MKATCHIIFCAIVRVISRISSQNFMKNIQNLSQEIEKCALPPKKLKMATSKGQYLPQTFLA